MRFIRRLSRKSRTGCTSLPFNGGTSGQQYGRALIIATRTIVFSVASLIFSYAHAQNLYAFSNIAALRLNPTSYAFAQVAGYRSVIDGGGGLFTQGPKCQYGSAGGTSGVTWTQGSPIITAGAISTVSIGMGVSSSTSVQDIPATGGGCTTSTIGTTAQSCELSVPCGRNAACVTPISVEAFGRMASLGTTNQILASDLDQNDQKPSTFSSAPGNTSSSSSATDAYPFRISTSIASGVTPGAIRVRANPNATAVNEMTDGWVWHRQQ